MFDHPHRRFNPLTGEWVLVSPHRTQRPWQGKNETTNQNQRPLYDPKCYLCPVNQRANGEVNPNYTSTFVFTNDFQAILPVHTKSIQSINDYIKAEPVTGTCRVICFSPHHNLTLAKMKVDEILQVINVWSAQVEELGKQYCWVQIFENKGDIMGCSNPHPHGQIWASNVLPNEARKEDEHQKKYFQTHHKKLLLDYLNNELEKKERIVIENNDWAAAVPFWAIWPFEILLLPKLSVARLPDLNISQKNSLAKILKQLLMTYDKVFDTDFPYSMGWHGAPEIKGNHACWQLHAHFYPPLLRSATVKKFMVGYEMLGEPQRDITAEQAAEKLRECANK